MMFYVASSPTPALAQAVTVHYSYVHGTTVDKGGAALSNVTVEFYASGALFANALTGSDGSFGIDIAYGTYSIYFTKLAYAQATKSVQIQYSDTNLGTVILSRALKLSTSTLGLIASPGDKEAIPFTVGDIGEDAEAVDFVITKPEDWTVAVMDQTTEVTKAYVQPGQSLTLQLELTVPLTAPVNAEYNVSLTAIGTTNSSLSFSIKVQRPAAGIDVTAVPPFLDVYAGSQARFKLELSNIGGYDELLNLTVDGLPQGLTARFEDASKQEITKLFVEAGQSSEPYVVVSLPKGATLGAQNFTVSATSTDASGKADLTLNVLGLYEITVTNENFYISLNVGGGGTFTLTLLNNGTQDIQNVKAVVTGTTPTGFTVSADPSSLSSLGAGEEASIAFTVQTQSDVNAGNYYLDFNVLSDQTQAESFTLQVGVAQETSWIIYAVVLIIVAMIGLFMVYRRFGRR